jgi:molybdopterin converting factor small subunit
MNQEIEVNIRGVFDHKFLKESFSLKLTQETTLAEVFQLIDKKLKRGFLAKFKGDTPPGWIILLNGERVTPATDGNILLHDQDQLSILSAIGGG